VPPPPQSFDASYAPAHECMFFQIARETILLLINNIHEKICSHVRKSLLEIRKLRKLRNLKNKKIKKIKKIKKFALSDISFFCTVFHFLTLYFENIALLLANQN
jgi:predicted AAA+ superfamily ATPase